MYVGLFGNDYGTEDGEGVSPTEREFDHATGVGLYRLVFVKDAGGGRRHPKMRALIGKAQAGLVRKRFGTTAELVAGLYAALVEYLESRELIRWGPFDAAPCAGAAADDLDTEKMGQFIRAARHARQFPLPEGTPPLQLLEHLNLLNDGRLTNAAVLLFGKTPQRFLISSEVRCAHFHGTEVAKPIPSYQVYKGAAFDLVDQAVDFVLSKINRSIGTRAEGARARRTYEVPPEVVTEAIVNAVAHRDYTDNGSVQVMLFSDRLEDSQPRAAAASADPRGAARGAPVGARQSAAGRVAVPGRVHRAHGHGHPGHDPPLRRSRPAGTGVRGHRRVRDDDPARGGPRPRGRAGARRGLETPWRLASAAGGDERGP